MQLFVYGAVLMLALLALALPALAFKQHWVVIREYYRRPLRAVLAGMFGELVFSEAGYTVTYCWPGGASGQSTTAPTAYQASQVNMMTAAVAIGDAETFALFTHNWGLPASFPSFLFPVITYRQGDIGTGPSTQLGNLTFNISNTNVITINKLAGVGNGGTFIVTLLKPTSLIR